MDVTAGQGMAKIITLLSDEMTGLLQAKVGNGSGTQVIRMVKNKVDGILVGMDKSYG